MARAAETGEPVRILLLASSTSYSVEAFAAAASRLGVTPVLGSDRCHVLADLWPAGAWSLDFRDPEKAAEAIAARAAREPVAGIVPTDECTARIAALAARRLGLRGNAPEAAFAAGDKLALRRRLTAAGLRQPRFSEIDLSEERRGGASDGAAHLPAGLGFPVVLKPLHLSASRGVMRADGPEELAARLARLGRLLARPELRAETALIESFVAGPEVALEGLCRDGELTLLALFDKPDPLDGPFFAETIYVTPSRLPAAVQGQIAEETARAARALGLSDGPIHAELRLAEEGPVIIELAARSIGGLCSRALRFGAGLSLEEILIFHAVGAATADPDALRRTGDPASGVLMLPVPVAGVLREVCGVAEVKRIPGVRDAILTARPGEPVEPLPEGNVYLGFVFAGGEEPEEVIRALREAHRVLRPVITPRVGKEIGAGESQTGPR